MKERKSDPIIYFYGNEVESVDPIRVYSGADEKLPWRREIGAAGIRQDRSGQTKGNGRMAHNYVLQVTAGSEYDIKTHKIVPVNQSAPITIDSEHINVDLNVRIQVHIPASLSIPSSPYKFWCVLF